MITLGRLVVIVVALTFAAACQESVPRPVAPDSILARATETSPSVAGADSMEVDATLRLIDSLGPRPATRMARRQSYRRSADGMLTAESDSAVNLGADSDVEVGLYAIGVVGVATVAPSSPAEPLLRYYFGRDSHTVAVTKSFTSSQNGCAESVSVAVTWVLRDGRVIMATRVLADQDGNSLSATTCQAGSGDGQVIYTSWPALAHRIGVPGT